MIEKHDGRKLNSWAFKSEEDRTTDGLISPPNPIKPNQAITSKFDGHVVSEQNPMVNNSNEQATDVKRARLNMRMSVTLSYIFLILIVLFSLLFTHSSVVVLSNIEMHYTSDPTPIFLISVLSWFCPISSVITLISPLRTVVAAIRRNSSNHGLQTRLFFAFAFGSVLNICYGYRKDIVSIVVTSIFGLLMQLLNIGTSFFLSDSSDYIFTYCLEKFQRKINDETIHTSHARSNTTAFNHLNALAPNGTTADSNHINARRNSLTNTHHPIVEDTSASFKILTTKLTLFLLGSSLIVFPILYIFMYVDSFLLSVVCTAASVFPYVATFSTFMNDIDTYRSWLALGPGPKKDAGPPGIDLLTLVIMQLGNVVWSAFGVLLNDPVVMISSYVNIAFASIQLVCFLCPMMILSVKLHSFDSNVNPYWRVAIDLAVPFVGTGYVVDRCDKSPCSTPSFVELSQGVKSRTSHGAFGFQDVVPPPS